jgi:glutaredoxin
VFFEVLFREMFRRSSVARALRAVSFVGGIALLVTACGRDASLEPAKDLSPKKIQPQAELAFAPPEAEPIEGRVPPLPKARGAKPGASAAPSPETAERAAEFERRVTEARRTVDITVYGASWCPSCRQARAWLDANGMAYNELDIDRSESANRNMRRLNPAGTIPVIDIEGEVIVGFAPNAVDRAIRRRAEQRVRMN